MAVQQTLTKFIVDSSKSISNTILSPSQGGGSTLTPALKKRIRNNSSPETRMETSQEVVGINSVSLNDLMFELKELRKENSEIKDSINFMSIKFDNVTREIQELKRENISLKSAISDLQKENAKLVGIEKKLTVLENEHEKLEQYSRRWNLLFDGVKEEVAESEKTIWQKVIAQCDSIGVNINDNDIQVAHRVGVKNFAKDRAIIVRFVSLQAKNEIMSNLRSTLRDKRQKKESLKGIPRIREHLTKKRLLLFELAKVARQEGKFFSCFVRDGTILVQQSANSKPKVINTEGDLN